MLLRDFKTDITKVLNMSENILEFGTEYNDKLGQGVFFGSSRPLATQDLNVV